MQEFWAVSFMACYALYQIYFVYLCLHVPSHLIIKCVALSITGNSVGYIVYVSLLNFPFIFKKISDAQYIRPIY